MKIDYPIIEKAQIQEGDTVLSQWEQEDCIIYYEFEVEDPNNLATRNETTYYLIDRPKPVFPEDYGTIIIAHKVRGIEFPEGIPLARQRGGHSTYYAGNGPMWKSFTQKISGADNHGERQIEDWVLAKVVPA